MFADPPTLAREALRRAIPVIAIVTLAGTVFRLAMIAALPLIVTPDGSWAPDGKGYLVWAQTLLNRGDFAGPAVRTPGYPALLAGVYALLGVSGPSVLIAQHLMGLATVALITLMAARIAGPWTALATGLLAASIPGTWSSRTTR
jgi:hypothetical protein